MRQYGARMAVFNRVSDPAIVLELLNAHLDWRQRLVQQFEFAGATTEARVTSSYDIRFPDDFLSRHSLPRWGTARLILPLGSRRKELLLRVALAGPTGEDAELVLRSEASRYQGEWMRQLLEGCPSEAPIRDGLVSARPPDLAAMPDQLWIAALFRAICNFTPHRVIQHVKLRAPRAEGIDALAVFLTTWSVIDPPPTHQDVLDWYEALAPVRAKFGAPPHRHDHPFSSSEVPVLVLEEIKTQWTPAEIGGFIDGYVQAVIAADDDEDLALISALAEYGREFEILVEATVPLGQTFSIRLSEDRPLGERTRLRQRLGLGEAQSVHIEARVDDHVVEFGGRPYRRAPRSLRNKPVLEYPDGTRRSPPHEFDGWRATPETIALYSTTSGETGPVDLLAGMRATGLARLTTWIFAAIDVIAAGEVLRVAQDGLYVERLAVLVVPTTLAATVVLAREQSALSARMQFPARLVLLLTLVGLWVATLVEIAVFVAPRVG
jgi:hypothetical protein